MTTPAELVALARETARETGAARVTVEMTAKGTLRVVVEQGAAIQAGPMDSGYEGRKRR